MLTIFTKLQIILTFFFSYLYIIPIPNKIYLTIPTFFVIKFFMNSRRVASLYQQANTNYRFYFHFYTKNSPLFIDFTLSQLNLFTSTPHNKNMGIIIKYLEEINKLPDMTKFLKIGDIDESYIVQTLRSPSPPQSQTLWY
jgi:hypothetical protein